MAVYDKIKNSLTISHGEENTVASFYHWVNKMFNHSEGYPVYFDKQNVEEFAKTLTRFPAIIVQQVDTMDDMLFFFNNTESRQDLLFYIYFIHSIAHGGSRRDVRRGHDQIMCAIEKAGFLNTSNVFIVDPIYVYNYAVEPPSLTDMTLVVDKDVQKRFLQEGELIQEELMVRLKFYPD